MERFGAAPVATLASSCRWQCLVVVSVLLGALLLSYLSISSSSGTSEGLPKPVLTVRTCANKYTISPTAKAAEGKKNVVFLIRTYAGFQEATRSLLENLDSQETDGETTIHAVILPTDFNSTFLLKSFTVSTDGAWSQRHFSRLRVHFHEASAALYASNCCQIHDMCTSPRYARGWRQQMQTLYGHYKPSSLRAKERQFCSGNNLLHYTLTDDALACIRDSFSPTFATVATAAAATAGAGASVGVGAGAGGIAATSAAATSAPTSSYVVVTNGDNAYSASFVRKMVGGMEDRPSLDFAMCDYLERGQGLVRSTLRMNQMDLGGMMFRLASLSRLGSLFLDAMPVNAWPSEYYAADALFALHLVQEKGATWGKVGQILFTHW